MDEARLCWEDGRGRWWQGSCLGRKSLYHRIIVWLSDCHIFSNLQTSGVRAWFNVCLGSNTDLFLTGVNLCVCVSVCVWVCVLILRWLFSRKPDRNFVTTHVCYLSGRREKETLPVVVQSICPWKKAVRRFMCSSFARSYAESWINQKCIILTTIWCHRIISL